MVEYGDVVFAWLRGLPSSIAFRPLARNCGHHFSAIAAPPIPSQIAATRALVRHVCGGSRAALSAS